MLRRGGILSLVGGIPPVTISFHGAAIVHQADSPRVRSAWKELPSLVPPERRASASIIEVVPKEGFSSARWASRCARCSPRRRPKRMWRSHEEGEAS